MIDLLKKLFRNSGDQDAQGSPEETRRLAAAALLIEVSRADFSQDAEEEEAMAELLTSTLGLERATVDELMRGAEESVDSAASLYEFTRAVNDHYQYNEKYALVEMMWRVAFADKSLHKYEEHLIRRVASLIYLENQDFIRSKLAVKNAIG